MTNPAPLQCFRAAMEDFLCAASFSSDQEPTPIQAATYVAVACRTGEVGLQTLFGGYLRMQLHKEEKRTGIPFRLAVNRIYSNEGKGKQPDFQVLEGKSYRTSLVVECKLMDAECGSNAHPNQILEGFEADLRWMKGIAAEVPSCGCLFLVSSMATGGAVISNHIHKKLFSHGAKSIGQPIQLWRPVGVLEGPYRLEVFLLPVPTAEDEPISVY